MLDPLPDSVSWDGDDPINATQLPESSTQQLVRLHNPAAFGTPFKPGQSGNPEGRESFRDEILARTRHGSLLVDHALMDLVSPNPKLHMYGHNWLTERAFGKAEQLVSGSVDHNVNVYQAVDTETLRTMCRQRDELLQLVREGKIRVVESVSIPESNETLSQPDSLPAILDVSTQAE